MLSCHPPRHGHGRQQGFRNGRPKVKGSKNFLPGRAGSRKCSVGSSRRLSATRRSTACESYSRISSSIAVLSPEPSSTASQARNSRRSNSAGRATSVRAFNGAVVFARNAPRRRACPASRMGVPAGNSRNEGSRPRTLAMRATSTTWSVDILPFSIFEYRGRDTRLEAATCS